MRRVFFVAVTTILFGCGLSAQIRAPRIGMVRQLDGRIRPVYGVTANFICGNGSGSEPVLAASFSDQAGLLVTDNRLILQTPSGETIVTASLSESDPLLTVEGSAETAAAWLPSSQKLLRWDGQSFVEARLDIANLPGKPVSIRTVGRDKVEFLLEMPDSRVGRAVLSTSTGAVLQFTDVTGISGPAFHIGPSLVGQDHHHLAIELPDGSRQTLPISGTDLTFQKASTNWLVITSKAAGRQWLIHIDKSGIEASELPQNTEASAKSHLKAAQ
jgi:hypothetical protein